jgi:hypothetical protein
MFALFAKPVPTPFTPFEARNIINSYDRVSRPFAAGTMTELERETPNGTKEF